MHMSYYSVYNWFVEVPDDRLSPELKIYIASESQKGAAHGEKEHALGLCLNILSMQLYRLSSGARNHLVCLFLGMVGMMSMVIDHILGRLSHFPLQNVVN